MAVSAPRAGLVVHIGADIHLAPDHRMNPRRLRLAIKIDHPVHDAVVGNRARTRALLLQPLHQRLDPARAVQQGIFRM